jgi:hypothetical protein
LRLQRAEFLQRFGKTSLGLSAKMTEEAIIDIHCHIFPDAFFQQMNQIVLRLGNIGARVAKA